MEQKHTLHEVPLFEKLSPTELKLITNIARNKRYKRNQIIFLEGEPFSGFYVILGGTVKVYRLNGDGEEVVLNTLGSFRSFGESALFSGSHFHTSCALAVEDTSVLFVPSEDFTVLMGKNPALAIRISEAFAVRLMELNRRFDLLASTARGRVARYLLNEVQLNNSLKLPEPVFNLVLRKKDLAAHLGIANATLSRIFKNLKHEKTIREVSRKVFITNVKRLLELSKD